MSAASSTPTPGPRVAVEPGPGGPSGPRAVLSRIAQGDIGSARVILGLIVIWVIFTIANDRFLTAVNLTNLALQIAATGLISVGVVFVLLLGEIDLSVGFVSAFTSAITAVLNVQHGWSPVLAIVIGLLAGLGIGLFQGLIITRFGVPPFVVTLAGYLGWQGALLWVLGETGTVNISDKAITDLANTFFSDVVSWILGIVVIVIYAAASLSRRMRRSSEGLETEPILALALRLAVVAAATVATIAVTTADRGLPLALCILVGFVIVFDYIARNTRFGRHVFAVGGNAEAARRAGIRVDGIKLAVFMIAGFMAACGGIMAASRLFAVNQSTGGGDLLLLAIAGPVIAGTSLFGGRGSVWSALLGALVIGSISNGMDLLALNSDVKYMVTAAVLLVAVILDALSRRQRAQAGRV